MKLVETLHTAAVRRRALANIRIVNMEGLDGRGAGSERAIGFVCTTTAGIVERIFTTRPAQEIQSEVINNITNQYGRQTRSQSGE